MKCKIYPQWKRDGAKVKKSVCIGTGLDVSNQTHTDRRKIALALSNGGTRITGEMVVIDFEVHAHGMKLAGYELVGGHPNEKRFYQEWWCSTYEEKGEK